MRAAHSALLICALLSGTRGSVYKPPKVLEVAILPGDEGDVSSTEVARRLQQLVADEALGAAAGTSFSVRLSEEELDAKVARLQNYKHLVQLGVVDDPRVVREALLAAGGNVPRAAIELRKAAEAHQGEPSATWGQEASCLSYCPTPSTSDAWAHVKTRDCFLQCYTGAAVPAAAGPADALDLELEMDLEIAEMLTAVGDKTGAPYGAKLVEAENGSGGVDASATAGPLVHLNLETSSWLIAGCALLLPVAWAISAAARRPKPRGVVEDLERLVALKASAALSDDEFAAAKRALLLGHSVANESKRADIRGLGHSQPISSSGRAGNGELSWQTGRRDSQAAERHPRVQKSKSWPFGAAEVARSPRPSVQ